MQLNTIYLDNINKQLTDMNTYLDSVSESCNGASQDEITKIHSELTTYLSTGLLDIRTKIVSALKPVMKPIADKLAILKPIVEFNLTDLASVINLLKSIVTVLIKGQYNEMLALQVDITSKVVILSNNLQAVSNHSFSNPNMPPLSVTIPPITLSDIT